MIHPSWCCHFLSETSCETRPFGGWLVCLVSVLVHCRWAPCLTIQWCKQSSCSSAASQSHCGSPWRGEETREEGGGTEDRRGWDGGNRWAGGQHGVEFRVNAAMQVCQSKKWREREKVREIMDAKNYKIIYVKNYSETARETGLKSQLVWQKRASAERERPFRSPERGRKETEGTVAQGERITKVKKVLESHTA